MAANSEDSSSKSKSSTSAKRGTYRKSRPQQRAQAIRWHDSGVMPAEIMTLLKRDWSNTDFNKSTVSGWLYKKELKAPLKARMSFVAAASGRTVPNYQTPGGNKATDDGNKKTAPTVATSSSSESEVLVELGTGVRQVGDGRLKKYEPFHSESQSVALRMSTVSTVVEVGSDDGGDDSKVLDTESMVSSSTELVASDSTDENDSGAVEQSADGKPAISQLDVDWDEILKRAKEMDESTAAATIRETKTTFFTKKGANYIGYLRRLRLRVSWESRYRLRAFGEYCHYPKVDVILAEECKQRAAFNVTRDATWARQRARELFAEQYPDKAAANAAADDSKSSKPKRALFAASRVWFDAFVYRHGFGQSKESTVRQMSLEEYVQLAGPWLHGERQALRDLGLTFVAAADGKEYMLRGSVDNMDEIPVQCWSKRKLKQIVTNPNCVQCQVWSTPATTDLTKRLCTFMAPMNPAGFKTLRRTTPWKTVHPIVILPAGGRNIPKKETKHYAKDVLVYSNKKGWMDGDIWYDYMKQYSHKLGGKGPRVIYCDNLAAHLGAKTIAYLKKKDVHLRTGLPNATDKWQPWDQSIGRYVQTHVYSQGFRPHSDELAKKFMKEQSAARKAGRKPRDLRKTTLPSLRTSMTRWIAAAWHSLLCDHTDACYSAWMACGLLLPFDGSLDVDFFAAVISNRRGALAEVHSHVFDSPNYRGDENAANDSDKKETVDDSAVDHSAVDHSLIDDYDAKGESLESLASNMSDATLCGGGHDADDEDSSEDDSSENDPLISVVGNLAQMGEFEVFGTGAAERSKPTEMATKALTLRGLESLQKRIIEFGYISEDAADDEWEDDDDFKPDYAQLIEVEMSAEDKTRFEKITKKMTCKKLKVELKNHGLTTAGLKEVLVRRLVEKEFGKTRATELLRVDTDDSKDDGHTAVDDSNADDYYDTTFDEDFTGVVDAQLDDEDSDDDTVLAKLDCCQ